MDRGIEGDGSASVDEESAESRDCVQEKETESEDNSNVDSPWVPSTHIWLLSSSPTLSPSFTPLISLCLPQVNRLNE